MAQIRMNTELRNKLFGKIKNVFENENTFEKEAYLQAREKVDIQYKSAFELAKEIVERAYPPEDVDVLRTFKKKYGDPCDVVAKDKCFFFAHTENRPLTQDENENDLTVKSHFDFSLYGNLNGNEYSRDEGRKFAYAYFRDELKAKSLNPDILAEQEGKDNNPYKTKHEDLNDKALGYQNNNDNIGLAKDFDSKYYVDVIGTFHCRSRSIPCMSDEYKQLELWRISKGQLVSSHQKWVDTIQAQCDQLKIGLKAYRFLSEGIELATELGIKIDEAELIRTNSTGLTIYNPTNLANLIMGMKNKNMSREAKILARNKYEKSVN
jgi:hypothetical protein